MILFRNSIGNNTIESVIETMRLGTTFPPMQPIKPQKKEKIKRIYEDNDFVIDLFNEEKMLRISIFQDGHFKDEVLIRKDDYK